jgi:antirestriction protein ArdC
MRDLYREVTDQIITELKTGARPWVKHWSQTPGLNIPANAVTSQPNSGVNTLLLWTARHHGWALPRFLTFGQAMEVGGYVRKGEHGYRVVFVKSYAPNADEQEEPQHIRFLKTFTVFNIAQCDSLPDKLAALPEPLNPHQRDVSIDEFIAATGASILGNYSADKAYYSHGSDCIVLPRFEMFRGKPEYYATIFHELIHWTGHVSRLDRQLEPRFGHISQAAEELIAELGAAFLCAEFSIDGFIPHAAYIEHYLKLFENDTRAIFTAASKAQAAVDSLCEQILKEPIPINSHSKNVAEEAPL